MQNTAKNYLKGNFLMKKDRKISLCYFNEEKQQMVDYIINKNNLSNRKVYLLDLLRRQNLQLANLKVLDNKFFTSDNIEEIMETPNDKEKGIFIVDNFQLILNDKIINDFFEKFENLFRENVKQIFLMIQLNQTIDKNLMYKLNEFANSIFDFTNGKNLLYFTHFNDLRIPQQQILSSEFKNQELYLNIYVDQKTQIEKKNPDMLINSTFKLSVNDQDKSNKDNLILPHYKDKQIEEMKQKVYEEYQLSDEEVEDLEDEIG